MTSTTAFITKFTLLQHKYSDCFLVFSFAFNIFCIKIIGDLFILSVLAWYTLNFSGFLVVILCSFSSFGNILFIFGCFDVFSAKRRQSFSLLTFNVSRFKIFNAFSQDLYLSPSIILNAFFCTLSKSVEFCSVMALCQTTAECSKTFRTNCMYITFRSSMSGQKAATLLRSSMRIFALRTSSFVFKSQLRLSCMTVPRRDVSLMVSIN